MEGEGVDHRFDISFDEQILNGSQNDDELEIGQHDHPCQILGHPHNKE